MVIAATGADEPYCVNLGILQDKCETTCCNKEKTMQGVRVRSAGPIRYTVRGRGDRLAGHERDPPVRPWG